jgi:hypothetical protein
MFLSLEISTGSFVGRMLMESEYTSHTTWWTVTEARQSAELAPLAHMFTDTYMYLGAAHYSGWSDT